MTVNMWVTIGILGLAVLLFITEWLRVDIVALSVVLSLMLSGILSPEDALAGFSSPIVVTVAALFLVGGAVMQTGLADNISQRMMSLAGKSTIRLLTIIMGSVAVMSGFISDTGTVAVMTPAVISLARRKGINPSKLLLPVSFSALLGGATTLIGTPPNIIVSDLLSTAGFPAFNFFDFTPIGLSLLLAGILYIASTYRWLLPDRKPTSSVQRVETPEEIVQLYKLPQDLYRLRVRSSSPITGQALKEINLRNRYQITVIEIIRKEESSSLPGTGEKMLFLEGDKPQNLVPSPDTKILHNDILICQGESENISLAAADLDLGVLPIQAEDKQALVNNEVGVAEVLLPPRSELIGKTLVSTQFGSRYHLTVLGINRPGTDENLPLKETTLQFGDTLIVQGPWKHIHSLRRQQRDFIVIGEPDAMDGRPSTEKMLLALIILAGMLLLLLTHWVPVSTAVLLAAFLMIVTGCLPVKDAYDFVDWKSVILIAGMLPMATALESVGLVHLSAEWLAGTLGSFGPYPTLASLFMITSLFTQIISNTATTVLIAPIALSLSHTLGYQPQALLMTVAIAASTAFASPVSSPVNTLVMGAGDYRFSDYLKVGGPLILVTMVVSLLLLPLLWPL